MSHLLVTLLIVLIIDYHIFRIWSLRLLHHQKTALKMISERTEQLFLQSEGQQVSSNQQISGAGGSSTLDGLRRSDEIWHALRKEKSWQKEPAQIVRINDKPYQRAVAEFDVVVCGGTLGLFYAVAMQLKGYKVCIIERGRVAGRPQEWNISEKELSVLVNLGLLKEADIKKIISIKFNPARVGFKYDTSPDAPQNGFELYVEDVLNLGVNPSTLIELLKERFLINGGILYENAALETVSVHPNLAAVTIAQSSAKEGFEVTARLVVDSMGNASPISRQARGPIEPDGICIVVGSCARGFQASNNTYSDVICTNTPISDVGPGSQTQFFWEAFPTGSGPTDRTTYMFTYLDAKPERPSVAQLFDAYWELLPRYQGVGPDDLQFLRFLHGVFPTYRSSPVQTPFDRILAVGDASGVQSPLSFGGFGSLTRHLERISVAADEALEEDLLTSRDMNAINAYQPNLAAAWMFQRSMSVPVGANPSRNMIVNLLANSFASMKQLGAPVLMPFLQDVLQFFPLARTLLLAGVNDPLTPFRIVPHVGLPAMLDFFGHFWNMFVYTMLSEYLSPVLESRLSQETDANKRFHLKRLMEAWRFGAGLDYH